MGFLVTALGCTPKICLRPIKGRPGSPDGWSPSTRAGARETGSLGAGHRRVTFPHVDESAEGDAGAMVAGPVTTRLAERMAGILAGTMPDKFGWIHHVYK